MTTPNIPPPFELREKGGKQVKVVVRSLTKDEARELFPYRPLSRYAESRFGGNETTDDVAILLAAIATRCKMCQAPTYNRYLNEGTCPDCDGRSERNGTDPYKK